MSEGTISANSDETNTHEPVSTKLAKRAQSDDRLAHYGGFTYLRLSMPPN